jgi:hypothetical protein
MNDWIGRAADMMTASRISMQVVAPAAGISGMVCPDDYVVDGCVGAAFGRARRFSLLAYFLACSAMASTASA